MEPLLAKYFWEVLTMSCSVGVFQNVLCCVWCGGEHQQAGQGASVFSPVVAQLVVSIVHWEMSCQIQPCQHTPRVVSTQYAQNVGSQVTRSLLTRAPFHIFQKQPSQPFNHMPESKTVLFSVLDLQINQGTKQQVLDNKGNINMQVIKVID